jgi:2-C-methyl-D-erythritol 4-phosphate cytidylyltransferase
MNTAIIVAAGTGSRFGSERPKQFLEILGKQLIRYSIESFAAAPSIDSIIVVVAASEVGRFRSEAETFAIAKLSGIVAGGDTRTASVAGGLERVDPRTDIVAIHDAARPLATVDEIERTIAAAIEHGAACLTAPVNDTIKRIEDGMIVATLDRSLLRRALTPQAFERSLLQKAFAAHDLGETVTDECTLVEKLGHPIASVDGSSANIKVTHRDDLAFVEMMIGNGYLDQI